MIKKLLELRRKVKKRKPVFVRQNTGELTKFRKCTKWRKARGRHSKVRLNRKGYRKAPSVGYGSPKQVRGLNTEGMREIMVASFQDLKQVGKNCVAVIRSSVGLKKRGLLLKHAQELGVTVVKAKSISKKVEERAAVIEKKKANKTKKKASSAAKQSAKTAKKAEKETADVPAKQAIEKSEKKKDTPKKTASKAKKTVKKEESK